jgi:hypothetical protein
MRVSANDEESRFKEASCSHKKTGSRPLVLSQRSQIAIASSGIIPQAFRAA